MTIAGRCWTVGLGVALLLATVRAPAVAQTMSSPRGVAAASPDARLDRLVDSVAAHGFSGLVLVATGARPGDAAAVPNEAAEAVLYERAVGTADRATGRPLRVDDVWRWASVTKQVTAALVMQQVDAGRLSLASPLADVLPTFSGSTARSITLRDLLQHTSGLPNPDEFAPDPDGMPGFYRATGSGVGDAGAVRGYCAGGTPRPRGVRFEYNNCDYLVLGAVLERVTGRSFAALVDEQLGHRLGATTVRLAGADETTPLVRQAAATDTLAIRGYLADGRAEPAVNLATFGAAGALRGTARDLLTFDRALLAHRLVSAAATSVMWRGDPQIGYAALGAWVFPATLRGCPRPVVLVERRGEIGGVQVRNVIAPELGRVVIVFTNSAAVEFGEIWQGTGLSHALLSAALCSPST